jgi:glycosyltransferase involved in cell wall biosynthesis
MEQALSTGEMAVQPKAGPSDPDKDPLLGKVLIFVWENFGPMHDDRCEAVARAKPLTKVIGLQLYGSSETYDWLPQAAEDFQKITLFGDRDRPGFPASAMALLRACIKAKATHIFLCHYERPMVALAALLLRLLRKHVFLLYDSKFDDYPRGIWREILKFFWLLPYEGAIVASARSRDYLRFLGMRPQSLQPGYNTISLARIRELAGAAPAPEGEPFASRHFTIVARLVEKKNLKTALQAYALYVTATEHPRPLRLFGAGPLEASLREDVRLSGLDELVHFEGFQQADAVCKALASSLALLLVSQEEQFGFAIIEALAMGVPVLISPACGAHDDFVRSGVNGFVVEPDNPEGMAFFMRQLAEDEALWRNMAKAALAYAPRADVGQFVQAVNALTVP